MDQGNLARIHASAGETKTLEQLMEHPHAKLAKLSRHHILALRLYTTSSFCKINEPLRKDPPPTGTWARRRAGTGIFVSGARPARSN